MAQNSPWEPPASRVPMMDASFLDDRTKPLRRDPSPIWLRHRLLRRSTSAPSRARAWIRQLAGRPPAG